jgi:N-acetylmuramic acid 6-phosphate etherase
MLKTEAPHPRHPDLDRYDTPTLVQAFVDDQAEAVRAVQNAAPQIAQAVSEAVPRLQRGGRLLYVGAGTSGRLGLLDAVELLPTFSWPPERAVPVLAGGLAAVMQAVEGAEDDELQAAADLQALNVGADDVVIVLAASGGTPYTVAALAAARAAGAFTIGLSNNPGAPVTAGAHVGITLDTGSEVISGSTRLKAGTAQKIALNTLSSSIMVRLNKVYGNLMVDLLPTNAKLRRRALQLTVRASGADEATARTTLDACDGQVKTAVVCLLASVSPAQARARLALADGSVRRALQAVSP